MRLLPAVVTSTIGRDCLLEAIESVARQTRPVRHYIFIDGPEVEDRAKNVIEQSNLAENTTVITLPNNTGKNMYTCARINAMASYMITEDVILYLDDDNWYEPDHIESLVSLIEEHNLDKDKVKKQLEWFRSACPAGGYVYADYYAAFKNWMNRNGLQELQAAKKPTARHLVPASVDMKGFSI